MEKHRWEESEKRREEKRREEERHSEKRMSQKKEDAGARKGRNVAVHGFALIWGAGGSKSRLAKAAGGEPAGQMRDAKLHAVVARSAFPSQNVQSTPPPEHFSKKCMPLWREARFQVKMVKARQHRSAFGS